MLLRIESGKVDPTFGMLRRLLEAAGQDLHLRSTRRPPSQRGRVLAELADAWVELPDEHPDWTKLRSFLDDLTLHPDRVESAIIRRPAKSQSPVLDTLLAGIAEKLADDAGIGRPAWTRRTPCLRQEWSPFGTPRLKAMWRNAAPPQCSIAGWSSMHPACGGTPRRSVPDPLLTPDRIRAYLIEVAELLPDDAPQCIVVVGGALLALLGFREATNDVDSIKRFGATLKEAVEQVANRHGLAPRWLNDSAAGYAPQTFDEAACTVELDHPRLRVLGAPLQQVFVMKLIAARAVDLTDLTAIWSECGFEC